MPTTSEVDICNSALQAIGDARITSIDQEDNRAKLCKQFYYDCRDSLLREAEWSSATKRVTLTAAADVPDWGYEHVFDLPSDCLRMLTAKDTVNEADVDYVIEESRLLCDEATVNIKYIKRITDPNYFDVMFKQTLIAFVAAMVGYSISGRYEMAKQQWSLYQGFVSRAKRFNEMERPKKVIIPTGLTDNR